MNFFQKLIQGFLDRLAAMVQGRAYIPQQELATQSQNDNAQVATSSQPAASPNNVAPATPNFYSFQTNMDGIEAAIGVDLAYQSEFPVASYVDVLELIVQIGVNNEQAVAADALLAQFRQSLASALYVGNLTSNGIRSFYLYLPQGVVVPDSLRQLAASVKYSYEVKPDANWSYYAELLPRPAEQPAVAPATPQTVPAAATNLPSAPAQTQPAAVPQAAVVSPAASPTPAVTTPQTPAMPAYNPTPEPEPQPVEPLAQPQAPVPQVASAAPAPVQQLAAQAAQPAPAPTPNNTTLPAAPPAAPTT